MADDQLRTRLLAYRIWEAEGCPDGQEARHWHLACRLVAAERITDVPQEAPAPPRRRTARADEEAAPDEKAQADAPSPARRRASRASGARAGDARESSAKTGRAKKGVAQAGSAKTSATQKSAAEKSATRKSTTKKSGGKAEASPKSTDGGADDTTTL